MRTNVVARHKKVWYDTQACKSITIDAAVSKWGRLRALPVAEEASKKEWQRSKKGSAKARSFFRKPQQDITGVPARQANKSSTQACVTIDAAVSKWS